MLTNKTTRNEKNKKKEKEMKGKIITYLIIIWFGIQAIFMLLWPIYLYFKIRHNFYEMLILGSIMLPTSLFVISKNKKIKKITSAILWVYSVSFALIGTLANLVASPKITLAIVSTIIMIINLVLLIMGSFNPLCNNSSR